jgi:hypothetical protein
MKVRRLEVKIDEAKNVFMGTETIDWGKYPKDARINRISYDPIKKLYYLVVVSREFSEIQISDYVANKIPVIPTHYLPRYSLHDQYVLMLKLLFPIIMQDYLKILPQLKEMPPENQDEQMTAVFKLRVAEYMKTVAEMEYIKCEG